MNLRTNYTLQQHNTFNIKVDAKYYVEVASKEELSEVSEFIYKNNIPYLVLGGGSNILFTENFDGLVIKANFSGVMVLNEDQEHVFVNAGAGEDWDDFVKYSVGNNWSGIENLSLIPGSVGASPVQNIGAYGVEMKDHFFELEYYNFNTKEYSIYKKADCNFGYRYSIFKSSLKGQGIVTNVTFKLCKKANFKTSYGAIQNELEKMGVTKLSLEVVRNAIISIRESKLPDPDKMANAGSFFKNPVIGMEQFQKLSSQFSHLVSYKQDNNSMKIAAGWLIDQCNWKGKRMGDAGVHENQALVIVNYGNATGREIYDLSEKIKQSVMAKFGVVLEREVNVY